MIEGFLIPASVQTTYIIQINIILAPLLKISWCIEVPEMLGIVEGFYGEPWSFSDRVSFLNFMARIGLDIYIYAPKDDQYHRRMWRKKYPDDTLKLFRDLVDRSVSLGVDFIYGISPGLDIDYGSSKDLDALVDKLSVFVNMGLDRLALLFDDIEPKVRGGFDTLAEAQAHVANHVLEELGIDRLILCPTHYWGFKQDYLAEIASLLDRRVDIMWTGTHVVSPSFDLGDIYRFMEITGRKPFIWDNYPVNDFFRVRGYLRLHLGGYVGRDRSMMENVSGYVFNPMNEAELSKIPIYLAAHMLRGGESRDMEELFNILGISDAAEEMRVFIDLNAASPMAPDSDLVIDSLNHRSIAGSMKKLRERLAGRKILKEMNPYIEASITIAGAIARGERLRAPPIVDGYRVQLGGLYSPPISDKAMMAVLGHSKRSFPEWLETNQKQADHRL